MSNRISDKVLGEMLNAEHKSGRRTRFIYLGSDEWNALEKEMQPLSIVNAPSAVGRRRTFNGAEIFRVDAKNHLGVSA